MSATNAEYEAKKIEMALKRLFTNIAATDRGRQALRRSRRKTRGKMWDDDEDSNKEGTYYQGADEESDDEDWFGNLAGVAEDENVESGDEEMMDAIMANQSAK